MEAEYLALSEAAKEAAFLQKLRSTLYNVFFPSSFVQYPIPLFTDSTAALNHVKNNVRHERTKHIDLRHHYIREAVSAKHVVLRHIPALGQAADILTKALSAQSHEAAMDLLRLTTV